jgi:hypothetical protein
VGKSRPAGVRFDKSGSGLLPSRHLVHDAVRVGRPLASHYCWVGSNSHGVDCYAAGCPGT